MLKKILLILFSFLLFFGCNKNEYEIPIISSNQIFEIDKDYYYVLIYLNGCIACRDVKQIIHKFDHDVKSYFYYVDLEKNKELLHNKLVSNINCSSYVDIKIKKTPTLFVIKNKTIMEEYISSDDVRLFLYTLI